MRLRREYDFTLAYNDEDFFALRAAVMNMSQMDRLVRALYSVKA